MSPMVLSRSYSRTRLLLNSLFAEQTRFLSGSNVVGVAIGCMGRKHARSILETYAYITNSDDIKLRAETHEHKVNYDFPNLEAHNLDCCSHNIMALIQRDGNSLYSVLSLLYKSATQYDVTNNSIPQMAVVEYVMLCSHLNKQLLLSAGTISNLWSETLKHDSILLLYDMSTQEFDAIQYVMQKSTENKMQ